MPIEREVIDAVRDMDEHQLRRLLMLTQARLEGTGLDTGLGNGGGGHSIQLRRRLVRCGKASCTTCPHGPYWYAFWREDGRRRSRYVGRLEDVESVSAGSA
jgi:hypothetical protein